MVNFEISETATTNQVPVECLCRSLSLSRFIVYTLSTKKKVPPEEDLLFYEGKLIHLHMESVAVSAATAPQRRASLRIT